MEFINTEQPIINDRVEDTTAKFTREVDECVHQISSKQDRIYTKYGNPDKDTEEWTLALWDGHGSTNGRYDTATKMYKRVNFMLDCLDDMITNSKEIDEILEKDIFSEEDPVIALQHALGRRCIEKKQSMKTIGATMVLVKVKRIISEKKIIVDVISCGDSTAIIYCNGEKVLENAKHNGFNEEEIIRLTSENRIDPQMPTKTVPNFEILDKLHVCKKQGKYIVGNNGEHLAISQSVGHLEYCRGKIIDELGVLGIAPYKIRLEFSETDELNIKLFSDGISDMISTENIKSDEEIVRTSKASELANLARARWEGIWKACSKISYLKSLEDPTIPLKTSEHCFNTIDMYGNIGTDDVSCISWIQTKKK